MYKGNIGKRTAWHKQIHLHDACGKQKLRRRRHGIARTACPDSKIHSAPQPEMKGQLVLGPETADTPPTCAETRQRENDIITTSLHHKTGYTVYIVQVAGVLLPDLAANLTWPFSSSLAASCHSYNILLGYLLTILIMNFLVLQIKPLPGTELQDDIGVIIQSQILQFGLVTRIKN